ncbi:DNA helicase [Elysia marginata]|uniref:DNA helicase n=1 Tax=Elysia marginata TaxID=1093978 RepID=A0AAV4GNK6_9GAST|nr:DNA helicase [Elysia marginata]
MRVIIDNKLNYKKHVTLTTTKTNSKLEVINRPFDHLTDHTLVQLFKTLVKRMVKYEQPVWQPSQKALQQELEDVQRRVTKLIRRREDPDLQQPGGDKRTSVCQEGHLTRTAKVG